MEKYVARFNQGIETEIKLFTCRSDRSSAKIEWQDQYFASCLLMPKYKLKESINGRDLTNWTDLYAIADECGITISNLTNRLKSLKWISLSSTSKQIYRGEAYPKS